MVTKIIVVNKPAFLESLRDLRSPLSMPLSSVFVLESVDVAFIPEASLLTEYIAGLDIDLLQKYRIIVWNLFTEVARLLKDSYLNLHEGIAERFLHQSQLCARTVNWIGAVLLMYQNGSVEVYEEVPFREMSARLPVPLVGETISKKENLGNTLVAQGPKGFAELYERLLEGGDIDEICFNFKHEQLENGINAEFKVLSELLSKWFRELGPTS